MWRRLWGRQYYSAREKGGKVEEELVMLVMLVPVVELEGEGASDISDADAGR